MPPTSWPSALVPLPLVHPVGGSGQLPGWLCLGPLPDKVLCLALENLCSIRDSGGHLRLFEEDRRLYKECHNSDQAHDGTPCGSLSMCYECFCKLALRQSMFGELDYCEDFREILLIAVAAQVRPAGLRTAADAPLKRCNYCGAACPHECCNDFGGSLCGTCGSPE